MTEQVKLIDQLEYQEKVVQAWISNPLFSVSDITKLLVTKPQKVRHVIRERFGDAATKIRAKEVSAHKIATRIAELTPEVIAAFHHPDMISLEDLARKLNVRFTTISEIWKKRFLPKEIEQRSSLCRSKAIKVHMTLSKKALEEMHKMAHYTKDGHGYLLMLKPAWFTGRLDSKHIYVHQVVMAENLGISEIPEGFVIHHINGDRTDNQIENLSLLTNSAHLKQHQVVPLSNQLTMWELNEFMMWKSQTGTAI